MKDRMTKNLPGATIRFIAIVLMAGMAAMFYPEADPDLWHRLMVGKVFFETGGVLERDIFAYTNIKPLWVDHEWGSGVIFYFLQNRWGDPALFVLKAFLFWMTLLLILANGRRFDDVKSPGGPLSISLVVLALLLGFTPTIRCQTFTYLFFALWLYALERVRAGEIRWLAVFPSTAIFWVNLHGGFLSGIGLVGLFAAGEFLNRRRFLPYLAALGLILPVTFVTPYGLDFWPYILEAAAMSRPYITEWAPLSWTTVEGTAFKIFLIAALLTLRRPFDWTRILVLAVTAYLGIRHQRHVVFFGITAGVYVLPALRNFVRSWIISIPEKVRLVVKFSCYGVLILVAAQTILTTPLKLVENPNWYPVHAVEYLQESPHSGNLLVPLNWGSYSLWKLYPKFRVSMDGRYEEVYPNETYHEVAAFAYGHPGWEAILDRYRHDAILIRAGTRTDLDLRKMPDWTVAYEDTQAVVFIPIPADTAA